MNLVGVALPWPIASRRGRSGEPVHILFIVASKPEFDHHTVGELPLGPAYLASYLKKHIPGCRTSIYVGCPSEERILDMEPDLIGISSVTDNFTLATALMKGIRRRSNIPIVLGGHHISYLPHLLPREATAGALFEGEATFLELIRLYDTFGRMPNDELHKIDGIVFWDDNELKITPRRSLIDDLDSIPFPDRDGIIIDHQKTYRHHILTSRGCPNKCTFCSSHPFWRQVRYFSPAYVVDEIQHLRDAYGIERLHIYDDLWIANKKRFFHIASLLKQRELEKKITFESWVTARTLTPEVARELRSLNFESVSIGFETGSERMLRALKGGSASMEHNRQAIKIAKENHLKVGGSFMIGLPGETLDDIEQTRQFIKCNDLDSVSLFLMKPLPGTEIWDYALREGLVGNDLPDWGILNNDDILHEQAILLNRAIDPHTLQRMRAVIQKDILGQRARSTRDKVFSSMTNPSQLIHYAGEALKKPGLAWSLIKANFSR